MEVTSWKRSIATGESSPLTGTSCCLDQQSRPTQHQADGLIDLVKRSISYRAPGDEHKIPPCHQFAPFEFHPHRLAHATLDLVARRGFAHLPSHSEAEAAVFQIIGQNRKHHQRMGQSAALTPKTFKIGIRSKTVLLTHRVPGRWPVG